jgi:multicomponent Na+:H+ antiporter subunit G
VLRVIVLLSLLSWGVSQHADSPASASNNTSGEVQLEALPPSDVITSDAPENSSETSSSDASVTPTTDIESTPNEASPHGEASHGGHAGASNDGERLGPPVVNTNLAEELLILFGSFFVLAAAVGMLRFPDFYTRLHASTKLVTLGGIGILIGAAFGFNDVQVSLRVILIIIFFFLTAPLSGYMIGRAGYLRGLPFYKEWGSVDEWQALGSGSTEAEATD